MKKQKLCERCGKPTVCSFPCSRCFKNVCYDCVLVLGEEEYLCLDCK